MASKVPPEVRTWAMGVTATIVRVGCAGNIGGDLQVFYYDCGLAIIDPDTGAQQVVPLPEKPISVGFHAATQTAMLSTHAHRICLGDTTAGKLVRFAPTRSDPDPVVVVSLSA